MGIKPILIGLLQAKSTAIVILLQISFLPFLYATGKTNTVNPADYPIIPTPQKIEYGTELVTFTGFSIQTKLFQEEAQNLKHFFKENGLQQSTQGLKVYLIKENINDNDEGYQLTIDSVITIKGISNKGIFYGIQTLKQLFRKNDSQGQLPELQCTDWPAFKIRGFMHDSGRNFQSIQQLKEQIEVLSLYKYNVFHWHLTDDPGWRLESKIYPQLQSEDATSRGKGKFYTQDDFKDVLAYCKARKITVIPEFDIPGHTQAFRKAFQLESMREERVLPILLELFDELCALAGPEEMPYIHIGTDEVRNKEEYVSPDLILSIMELIKNHNREVITWKEGIDIKEDTTSINQLWAQHPPKNGHRFIDSRANYINHLDPFAGMSRLFFQQPGRTSKGDSLALGGILCAWPDNNVAEERDILKQNPIYPSIVFYSDAIWKGRVANHYEYWAKLPPIGTKEFADFKNFEEKVIKHKRMFFKEKEFPYVKQTDVLWNVIGPFEHHGDYLRKFPVEDSIEESYTIANNTFTWSEPISGATTHFKHYFDFPALTTARTGTFYALTEIYSPNDRVQDFWIGFQGWSRSGGRRGGPTPKIGQWHNTNPKMWVNSVEILPPTWQQPNLGVKTDEIPFIDEDYFYREPTKVQLIKGWNKVLLKIPHGGDAWKWMFTCIPINIDDKTVQEVDELKFRTKFSTQVNNPRK